MSLAAQTVYALSSDLTGSAAAAVSYLWDILEARFGIAAMKAIQRPHLTYIVGTCPEVAKRDLLMRSVATAARSLPAFSLELDGLSSFDTDSPVLFLRAVKHQTLLAAHDAMFRAAAAAGMQVDPHYHPGLWTPHCPLANRELRREQVPGMREFLRSQPLIWRCPIVNIDLLRLSEPVPEYIETWPLSPAVEIVPAPPVRTRLAPLQAP